MYSELKPCSSLVGATAGYKEKPASAGNISKPAKVPTGSLVELYRNEIEAAMAKGLTAQRIIVTSNRPLEDWVKWTSSDTSVAIISADGAVTGVGAGSSLITATLSGITSPAASLTVVSASIETSP